MRNALPNAAFIGFTGTPLMAGEEKTRAGLWRLRQHLQLQAVGGRSAPPSRSITRTASPNCNSPIETSTPTWSACSKMPSWTRSKRSKLEREFAREYHLITRDDRLEKIAEDIVQHFLATVSGMVPTVRLAARDG